MTVVQLAAKTGVPNDIIDKKIRARTVAEKFDNARIDQLKFVLAEIGETDFKHSATMGIARIAGAVFAALGSDAAEQVMLIAMASLPLCTCAGPDCCTVRCKEPRSIDTLSKMYGL